MPPKGRAWVVDGANAVHALEGSWPGGHAVLDQAAVGLIKALSRWSGPGTSELEIVFDGPWRSLGGPFPGVRVQFAAPDPADSLILERVRALRYRGLRVTVVTRDQALADAARAEEARVEDPDILLSGV